MTTNDDYKVPRRGYLYVVGAAILWAISGSSSKFLFNSGVTPFQLVQLRTTLSAAILFLIFFFARPKLLKVSPKDIVYFIILGTIGMAAVQFTYLFAISKIQVAAAILLEYMAPIFIALHAVIFFRDRLSLTTVTAIVGSVIGCYFVVGAYNLDLLEMNRLGILSGIGAAVSFAFYSIHGEYGMRRYDPWTVVFYALLFAAVAWNLLHPPLGAFFKDYSLLEWVWIIFIATLGTIAPFACYFHGINLIRSTRASITAILEPIFAGILSFIFLNEIMESLQLFGGVLVIGAIVLLQLQQAHDEKTPSVIRARNQKGVR